MMPGAAQHASFGYEKALQIKDDDAIEQPHGFRDRWRRLQRVVRSLVP